MSDCGVFCTIGNWLWGDLSDYGEVSARIPTPTATACVSAGDDQCQALHNKPEVVSGLAVTSPNLTAAGTLPYGSPVNFEIETNACNGQAGNLNVTLVIGSSGGIQEFPMTDSDGNGIFSAQLTAFYWNAPITVVIKDLDRGTEVRQQAYQVPTVVPGDTEPADQCAWNPAPMVIGIPQMTGDPSNVFAGDTLSFFFPVGAEDEYGGLTGSGIIQCDGVTSADADNNIEISFIAEGVEYLATTAGGYYQSPAITMTSVGNQKVYMKVTDTLHGATCQWPYPSIEFYVHEAATSTTIPSATISSNLHYSYHVGELAENITCYSDDPDATFQWTITRPGPDEYGDVIQYFTGPTIGSYLFDLQGDFDFKCEVAAGDGVTQNFETRSVSIYPVALSLPSASITAPFAGHVGEAVSFIAAAADEVLYSYSWEFGDLASASGADVAHAYATSGTYMVRLTVAYLSDPEVTSVATQFITITPVAIDPPVLSMNAPYAAEIGAATLMTVVSPDTANWDYTWDYGDGTALEGGTAVAHTYTAQGTKTIQLKATSLADPSVYYIVTQTIAVVPPAVDIPTLSMNVPYAAHVSEDVGMIVVNPDEANWIYTWEFGDSPAIVSGTAVSHPYAAQGTYTVKLTATNILDPSVEYNITQSIAIVPVTVDPPALSMSMAYAAHVGDSVAMSVDSPDAVNWNYSWDYGDGSTPGSGTSATHAYGYQGTKTVQLTATSVADPSVRYHITQTIAIVPVTVDPPALSMTMAYAAHLGTSVAMSVDSPDTVNWNYSWDYGDGSTPGTGDSSSHTYGSLGTKTVQLTATSVADPSVKYKITQTIAIVPVFVDIPALSMTCPHDAHVGVPIAMSVDSPDVLNWSYTWNYGDGSPNYTGVATTHAYSTLGAKTVKLTATSLIDPTVKYVITNAVTVWPS